MIRNWFKDIQSFFIKLRLDYPGVHVVPRFRITIYLLWILAIAGLADGHLFAFGTGAQSSSLLLSAVAAVGALFIILLRDPWPRFQFYLRQLVSVLAVIITFALAFLTFVVLVWTPSVSSWVKIFWSIGTLLMAFISYRSIVSAFLTEENQPAEIYPAMRTAPLLAGLLLANYLIWQVQAIISLLR